MWPAETQPTSSFNRQLLILFLKLKKKKNIASTQIKLFSLDKVNHKTLKWPVLFQRLIDDGFVVMECTKKDVSIEYWITQFIDLRKSVKIRVWSFGNEAKYMVEGKSFTL